MDMGGKFDRINNSCTFVYQAKNQRNPQVYG